MKHTKRILSVLLALLVLALSVPFAAAEDVTVVDSGTCGKNGSNLTWSLDSEGTLTISGEGKMDYYDTTYDNDVSRTDAPWGKHFKTIQSVVLGNSVTNIGGRAFYNCASLESVTIPDSVTSIGEWAFSNCTALQIVTIGNSVTSIGMYAFENCASLESVTIGNSVTSIGCTAFYGCTALESVTMGNSVTSIDSDAFLSCSNLSKIYLTDLSAWLGSSNLGNITTYGKSEKAYYLNGEPLTDVVVPNGVTQIPSCAFYNCKTLSSVTIPDSVTSIGSSAFRGCTALESVTIPDSVTSIGDSAFSGNNSWYTLALCNKNSTTAATLAATSFPYAFLDGTDEDNLIIERVNESLSFTIDKRTRTMTVQTNGTMVSFASFSAPWLEYQKYITDVVILPGCTSVSARAFRNCYNLKRVILPDGIESIGASAFENCYSLMQINLPDSVETIGSEAFRYCTALESVTIGDSVTSIGDYAFYGCTALESVTIGDSVTSIGSDAFSGCSALESVTIPDSVTRIGYRAFYNCTALRSADLGSGLTSIGQYAFYNSGLESIVIPDSVNTLNDYDYNYYYGYTFASCRSLKTVVIGDGLDAIPCSAFSGCTALETVSIGENVTAIYESAFSGCTSLHTVVLPESVKTICSRSFPQKALKDLYIYNAGQCDIAEDAVFYSATIHANPDSPAANFFENRGYTFEPLTDAPAHEHDSTLVKGTEPTCTDAGLTDGYKCSVCGKWITKQKPIKALGHDYVLKETVPPTDTENGFKRYECSRCDAAYTEVIPVSSHEHSYTVTDSRPATCLEGGFTTYVCYGCGHSYTDILEPLNHAFGAWKTFLPTEAGVQGIDVRFCSSCGAYELRESESTGTGTVTPVDPNHEHSFVQVESKEPDCENAGYVRSLCACGAGKVEIKNALGHDFKVTVYAPTCVDEGYTGHACTRCRYGYNDSIVPALGHEDKNDDGKCDRCGVQTGEPADPCANGHDLGDWVVRSEPTCTQPGFRSKYCKRCYQPIETEEIAKLGHDFKVVDKRDATCSAAGFERKKCTRCQAEEYKEIEKLQHIDENKDGKCDRCGVQTGEPADPCKNGHDLGDWVTRSEPTCTKPGYKSKYCKNCNQPIETEEIAALGHDFKQSGEISATCTDRGTRTERCTRCGTEQYEIIEALGHTDGNKDGKCDRCKEKITDGEEDLNFFQRIIRWFENLFAKLFGKEN